MTTLKVGKMIASQLHGFDFAKSVNIYRQNQIPHIDIAVTGLCNLHCTYCSLNSGCRDVGELNLEELKDVLSQCKSLGLITASVTGKGEPFLDNKYLPLAKHIGELGISQVWFSNGTRITREIAVRLNEYSVSTIVKLNSLRPEIHNSLVGHVNGFQMALQGLQNLMAVYDQPDDKMVTRLGVQTLVTKATLEYIPELLEFCAKNRLYPIVDLVIPAGKMIELRNYEEHQITADENKWLYKEFERIMGYSCYGPQESEDGCPYGIGICVDNIGNVLCSEEGISCLRTPMIIGNVRKEPISTIYQRLIQIRTQVGFKCAYIKGGIEYFLPCPIGRNAELEYYKMKSDFPIMTPYEELVQLANK